MKKPVKEEIPLLNVERSPVFLLFWAVFNGLLVYLNYYFFSSMNPWGFIIMTPTVVMSFLTLWLLLNPFAVFFEDKIEFKQSFFNNSTLYFIDVKKVLEVKNNRVKIVYNDDDLESFVIYGIKPSHKELLRKHLESSVSESIQKRQS